MSEETVQKFECANCDAEIEVTNPEAEDVVKCPACGAAQVLLKDPTDETLFFELYEDYEEDEEEEEDEFDEED